MLEQGKKLVAYTYQGYWKDVGTIASLHQANMDLLLSGDPEINLFSAMGGHHIYSEDNHATPQFIGPKASVRDSLINQGACVLGSVDHCVISSDVIIAEGASVVNSVIMGGAYIAKGAKVYDAMIGPNTLIEEGETVNAERNGIALVCNSKAERKSA